MKNPPALKQLPDVLFPKMEQREMMHRGMKKPRSFFCSFDVWSNIMEVEIYKVYEVNIRQDTKDNTRTVYNTRIVYNIFNASNTVKFPWATCSLWSMGTTSSMEACWSVTEKSLKEASSFWQAVMKVLSCCGILKGGLVNFSEQDTADTLTQKLAARWEMRDNKLWAAKRFYL